MFIPCNEDSDKLLLYLHANAEDAGLALSLLRTIRDTLDVHILAVEYPGYGVYKGTPSEETILKDAETVYDFLTKFLKIKETSIHLFGRSLGTGPCLHLGASKNPGSIILLSPYLSIKEAGQHLVGKVLKNLASVLIKDRFLTLTI